MSGMLCRYCACYVRLLIALVLFFPVSAYSADPTPAEFCADHVKLDAYYKSWGSKENREKAQKVSQQKFAREFSKYYAWDMEAYFSCRRHYDQLCKQFGKAVISSYTSSKIKRFINCNGFKE